MRSRGRRAGSAVMLGLALAFAPAADAQPAEAHVARLEVPHDRSTIDVLARWAASRCAELGDGPAMSFAPAEGSGSALERRLVAAAAALASAGETTATGGRATCELRAARARGDLVLTVAHAGSEGGSSAPIASAALPWDAELAAASGEGRSIDEREVRATRVRLPGSGFLAALAAPRADGEKVLWAARADAVDVFRLRVEASGRIAVTRVASGLRPEEVAPAAAPRRRMATLAHTDGGVEIQWADRASPYALAIEGDEVRFSPRPRACGSLGHRVGTRCARRVPGRDYFASRVARVADGASEALPSAFYTLAQTLVRAADGSSHPVSALVSTGGRLVVRAGRRDAGMAGHGLAVAIADVDLDGQAEVLASSDRAFGEGDRLTLYRVRRQGAVVRLWRGGELRGSVSVAAAMDIDEDGRPELVAIEEPADAGTEASLWVVR